MNRVPLGLLILALGSLTAASKLHAQNARFGLGGGAVLPLGDYGTADKTGWHLLGLGEFDLPASPVSIRIDAMYGQTSHDGVGGKTKLGGGTANVVWNVGPSTLPARVYLLGGIGTYNVKIETGFGSPSETKFAFDGGGGVSIKAGSASAFAEVRFISVLTSGSANNFVPITGGVSFSLR